MLKRTKLTPKLLAVTVFAVSLSYLQLADEMSGAPFVENVITAQSSQKAQNPCNPCSKKKQTQNPCNPCGKKAQNPCNPWSGKMKATGKVYQDAANYRNWAKLHEPNLSVGHGGKYVVTYANASADAAIKSGRFPFKNGAKFIKEGYEDAGGPPGELTTLYVMEKRSKDWYYAMTDVKGNIQMEGMSKQAQMCHSCHAGAQKQILSLRL